MHSYYVDVSATIVIHAARLPFTTPYTANITIDRT